MEPSVNLEVEVKGVSALEGADVLGLALLAVALGPQLVVGILRELAEAIRSISTGNLTHHRERVVVLEIDDSTLKRRVRLVDNLAVDGALHRTATLRYADLGQNKAA